MKNETVKRLLEHRSIRAFKAKAVEEEIIENVRSCKSYFNKYGNAVF